VTEFILQSRNMGAFCIALHCVGAVCCASFLSTNMCVRCLLPSTHYNTLIQVCCYIVWRTATSSSTLQYIATLCNRLHTLMSMAVITSQKLCGNYALFEYVKVCVSVCVQYCVITSLKNNIIISVVSFSVTNKMRTALAC